LILGRAILGTRILGEYRPPEIHYIPEILITPFDGYLFVVRGKTGYTKFKYSALTGLRLFSELVFSFSENGCDRCEFSMIIKPESLGFKIEDNDLIEIFLFDPNTPAWSGVIIDPGNEWRNNDGVFSFEAIGYAQRSKGFLANQTFSGQNIGNIAQALASDMAGKDTRLFFDPSVIEAVPTILTMHKIDRKSYLEAWKKLADISGNVQFSVLGDRKIRFQTINTNISPGCVFHAESPDVRVKKIERSKTDKIKNIYVLDRKAGSGTGSAAVVGSSGSPSDPAYSLNGVIRHAESIREYGEYLQRESIPETTNDTDAIRYGIQKCILTAFPQFKIELTVPFSRFSSLKVADGKCLIFNKEELFIDEFEDCENATRWTKSGAFSLTLNDTDPYSGRGCIQFSGSVSAGDFAFSSLVSVQDFSQVREVSFWAYSDTAGNVFDLIFGDALPTENVFPVFISETNRWQLVRVIVSVGADISKIGILFKSNISINLKLDSFLKQYLGRKKYDLQIKNVEYVFRPDAEEVNIVAGTIEKPFVDIFVDSWRAVEAQKSISSGGT